MSTTPTNEKGVNAWIGNNTCDRCGNEHNGDLIDGLYCSIACADAEEIPHWRNASCELTTYNQMVLQLIDEGEIAEERVIIPDLSWLDGNPMEQEVWEQVHKLAKLMAQALNAAM